VSAEPGNRGSFALDGFEDEGDADFEAEFAALAAPLKAAAQPVETKSQPDAARAAPPPPLSLDPEPSAADGPLALFDLPGDVAMTAPPQASGQPERKPSARPESKRDLGPPSERPAAPRDPDAEFDALFADATSPSGVPATPTVEAGEDEDSVDDLLRDLSSPRLPLDLAAEAGLADALESDLEGVEPAQAGAAQKRDADNPFPTEEELASSEFEIVMDEDEEDDSASATGKPPPAGKPRPPQPPPAPEKRPSFLGRLFGPKKD
jgi:hypothetical protein